MRGKEGVGQTAHPIAEVNQGDAALPESRRRAHQDVMSAVQTCRVARVPDHGGKQLNTVQDANEDGAQDTELPQQSQA